ncbi:SDR family oxidoreductase [Trinickia dinghuensis]|uniref:SDR family NAD(P)-dependent oxidoreductase n=1 Tax=Trinickia dinghuensis TaxID=2291023 RepID=A0A3D8JPF3_9BURK|nr:SDR family oxidoreductase [Trinickia dinghuensis]RDU94585.1 SDR family NAD(P)-dependent oxidoreductase [Trinickia dinghuensis]
MDLGLQNKTALVMGGGGGLGRAIAVALASEGANVALADLDAAALEQSAEAVRVAGAQALALPWDMSDLSVVDARIETIEQRFGSVDILVNNTGGPPPTPASGQPSGVWEKYFRLMVLSAIAITDRVLPGMRAKQWGRVITSTSSGVVSPIPNLAISNALRMSLVGWSKTLAREVAANGITANVILPGRIATDRIRFLDEAKAQREGRAVEEVAAQSTSSIPMGRYGRPEEYADVVAFLASTRASYMTGGIVRVDGGLIASI